MPPLCTHQFQCLPMNNTNDPMIEVPAGQTVFQEGDVGMDMFIIESGTIEIRRAANGMDPIATLGSGDFFGDMAMLEDQPRSATAIATANTRLLRIERAAFTEILKQNAEIAVRIMRKLIARQRLAEQQLQVLKSQSGMATAPNKSAEKPVDQKQTKIAGAKMQLRHVASGECVPLDPQRTEFLIGRPDPVTGTEPEINLGNLDQSRTLSRRHAKLLQANGTFVLREEVGTTNGTFVNDERIKPGASAELKSGDRLRFGSVEVEFAPV